MKISNYKIILCCACIVYSFEAHSQNKTIDSLKRVLLTQKEDTNKAITLNNLCRTLAYGGYPLEAFDYIDQSIALCEKLNFIIGKDNAYFHKGFVFNLMGNNSEAIKYYYLTLKMDEELHDKGKIGQTLQGISNLFFEQGNITEAIRIVKDALKFREEARDSGGLAQSLNTLGEFYLSLGNYTEALQNHLTALKICEMMENRPNDWGIPFSYNCIGAVYEKQADNADPEKKKFSPASGYAEALKYYLMSLKKWGKIESREDVVASLYIDIGNIHRKLGKLSTAKGCYQKSLDILLREPSINKDNLQYCYQNYSTLDSVLGDYKEAFAHYKMSVIYRDSLVNDESKKKSLHAQMQYEFDKKDAATKAEQVKKDALANEEIKRQRLIKNSTFGSVSIVGIFSFFLVRSINRRKKTTFDNQVSQVEMKALRAQMNPHFIFNSLNSIHSFIQQNKGEKASDYLIKFSRLMRLILENSNHEEVPLESDLEALSLYMELEAARMNNKFTFSIDVADDIDKENTMVPPLILQPFVENWIWHGMMHKEENGLIQIKISKSGDMVKCIVQDNGVGRGRAKELKSTTQKGKHESLGMKITNERIAIINRVKKSKAFVALKDLHDDAKKPLGTLVEVQLPLEMGF